MEICPSSFGQHLSHTLEKVIFQAPRCHIFVDQKSVIIITAIPDELHEIRVFKLSQIVDFSLHKQKTRVLKPNKICLHKVVECSTLKGIQLQLRNHKITPKSTKFFQPSHKNTCNSKCHSLEGDVQPLMALKLENNLF